MTARPTARRLRAALALAALLVGTAAALPVVADVPLPPVSSGTVVLDQPDPDGGTLVRRYDYTVPQGDGGPLPVVVALHGRQQTPAVLDRITGLRALGAERGFVTVEPEGLAGVWASGTCCTVPERPPGVDDVAFLDAVLSDLATRTPVDPARVSVVGFSNGGMMAWRYACQGAHALAGVAVVAGSMTADAPWDDAGPQRCRPRPTSVLVVHGSLDPTVPYLGGVVAGARGARSAPVRAGVDLTAVVDGCRVSRSSRVGRSSRLDYTGCADGTSVRLVKLLGFGHGWTRDSARWGYDTSVGVWSFLAPRRAVPAS